MRKTISKHAYTVWSNLSLGAVIIVIILSLAGSIYGLRNNNLRMVELREAVFTADREDGDVEAALQDLRAHVLGHMNTNLSRDNAFAIEGEQPIQRVYGYYRDSISEYLRITTLSSPAHVQTLSDARVSCEVPEVPITQRLECVQQYTADNGGSDFPVFQNISKDNYVHDFETPYWSPDLAGFSLVALALSIFLLSVRFIAVAIISRLVSLRN